MDGDTEKLQKEIARLTTELEETRAITFRYLQNVAHQLTAPLGAIKWSIEALKDERVPLARKKTLLSSVYSQATILVHLIKNFALMSNLEADHELGQFREQPEPTDLMRLAINLANDFQPQAYDVGIRIDIEADSFRPVFGSKLLLVEKNLVSQALSNLIENAVKYADRDTRIRVFATRSSGSVGVTVESSGTPIPEDEKSALFERGFRGASARQKVPAGTGIGLFLASRVMRFHGGSIDLHTSGRLSRFSLLFPEGRLAAGGK